MAWKLCQTALKTASLENSRLEPGSIPAVLRALRDSFGGRFQAHPYFGRGPAERRLVREIAETIINNQEEQP